MDSLGFKKAGNSFQRTVTSIVILTDVSLFYSNINLYFLYEIISKLLMTLPSGNMRQ